MLTAHLIPIEEGERVLTVIPIEEGERVLTAHLIPIEEGERVLTAHLIPIEEGERVCQFRRDQKSLLHQDKPGHLKLRPKVFGGE